MWPMFRSSSLAAKQTAWHLLRFNVRFGFLRVPFLVSGWFLLPP